VLSTTSEQQRNEQRWLGGTGVSSRLAIDGPAEEAYPLQFSERAVGFFFPGRNAGQRSEQQPAMHCEEQTS
jgi:hypothetical protein